MKISVLPQTKCLPSQYAIHNQHGWCKVLEVDGHRRVCMVEDGADSHVIDAELVDLRAVDPLRDLAPPKMVSVFQFPGKN